MLRNYLIVAFRNLFKHKTYSFINVFGLAFGLAGCILLFLFVQHELSYDDFHHNRNAVYRIVKTVNSPYEGTKTETVLPAPMGPALKASFPEILRSVRLSYTGPVVKQGNSVFNEQAIFADSDFFDMFSFPMLQGSAVTALLDPNSVVLTRDMAEKYFPDKAAIGQILSVRLGNRFHDFLVTAVVEDIPDNSSIQFGMVLPYQAILKERSDEIVSNWGNSFNSIFVQLQDGSDAQALQERLSAFTAANFGEIVDFFVQQGYKGDPNDAIQLWLQPLASMRRDTRIQNSYEPISDPVLTYILSGVAFVILIIACINFINLAIARAFTRIREIGVRKVVGAVRFQLIKQFWGEATLLSLVALIAGIGMAELLMPRFNLLTGKSLDIVVLLVPKNLLSLMCITLLAGLLAGAYPAVMLSRVRPVEILSGKLRLSGRNPISKSLIVFQFFLSIVLIICMIGLSRQVDFLRTKNLGFNTEQTLVIPFRGDAAVLELYRDALAGNSEILNITMMSNAIGGGIARTLAEFQEISFQTYMIKADHDFFKALDLELLSGRNFSRDIPTDVSEAVIINESFARRLAWEDPLGKQFRFLGGQPAKVIGVVKDFHFASLHYKLGPLVIHLRPERDYRYLIAKIQPGNMQRTIGFFREQWQEIIPDQPFSFSFLDDRIDRQYRLEANLSMIVSYSTLFATFIGCLGLFGLSALTTARRTKEIGIRKVLGASVVRIAGLVSREFLILVAIANILAWPLAYFVVQQLLQFHAYRIDFGIGYFLFAGVLSVGIAIITVGYQAIRAALANPVDSLRYE